MANKPLNDTNVHASSSWQSGVPTYRHWREVFPYHKAIPLDRTQKVSKNIRFFFQITPIKRRIWRTVSLRSIFVVWTLNNSIYRASFLTEATVDTLGHVDIVTSGSTGSIFTFGNLDSNSLRWARRFAQLAGNATLFTRRIAPKSMLTTESRRNGTLLEWVVDSSRRTQKYFTRQPPGTENLCQKENLGRVVKYLVPWCLL